jgi:AcrR family transcriptional regulator
MRRAIRDEQKEQRRQAILEVAWLLFQSQPYEAINMQEVATCSGLAKGTLYLYFQTKEELFLALLEQQFVAWMEEINALLTVLPVPATPEVVVSTFGHSLNAHPALLRLLAMSHSILEHNVVTDVIARYKQVTLYHVGYTGQILERLLPILQPGDGARFLIYGNALVVGLYGMAHPAPNVATAFAETPALAPFQIDFAEHFQFTMLALLQGWSS